MGRIFTTWTDSLQTAMEVKGPRAYTERFGVHWEVICISATSPISRHVMVNSLKPSNYHCIHVGPWQFNQTCSAIRNVFHISILGAPGSLCLPGLLIGSKCWPNEASIGQGYLCTRNSMHVFSSEHRHQIIWNLHFAVCLNSTSNVNRFKITHQEV